MFNYKRFSFFCVVVVLVLVACNQKDSNVNEINKAEEIVAPYIFPTEKNLSETEKQQLASQCQIFYDTVLNLSGFNGGIIVAKNGQIVFEKYRGSLNLAHVDSINSSTPLHIASVSKTFTAMAILKLQELGKLNVDDTLTKYFPDFNYPAVTIKTLLNHRSGLPNYLYFMDEMAWPQDSIVQNKNVLDWIIKFKAKAKDTGPANTKFSYNNTNYVLLALIIEKVSGLTYPTFMQKYIFAPLNMSNTAVRHLPDTLKNTKSFDWKGREINDNHLDQTYGDKGIYTTPRDLLKWDRALTQQVFLSEASLKAAYTPYSNEKPGIKNYGLGWRMNIYGENKKIIFHNGWWHGCNATFIRLLQEDATIIVISNKFTRSVYGAKLLANVFGNYFDPAGEDSENIIPSIIPETFTEEEKYINSNKEKFKDRNRKQKEVIVLPQNEEPFQDMNKKEE
jgi:CubicO group peptidase (beta-lactamase class C family)